MSTDTAPATDTATAVLEEMNAVLEAVEPTPAEPADAARASLAGYLATDLAAIRSSSDDLAALRIEHLADRLSRRIVWLESDLARTKAERDEANERATKWMSTACDLVTNGFRDAMELGRTLGQRQATPIATRARRPEWIGKAAGVTLLALLGFFLIAPAIISAVNH